MFASLVRRSALTAFALILAGCGNEETTESDAADPLFSEVPTMSQAVATPDQLPGLWVSQAEENGVGQQRRIRFDAQNAFFATRCHFSDGSTLTVSAEVPYEEAAGVPLRLGNSKFVKKTNAAGTCNLDIQAARFEAKLSGLKLAVRDATGVEAEYRKSRD